MTDTITTPQGRRIAYHRTPGQGPGGVFLGGFKSDMTGTKALYLANPLAPSLMARLATGSKMPLPPCPN